MDSKLRVGTVRPVERPPLSEDLKLVYESVWRKNPGDLFLLAAVQLREDALHKRTPSPIAVLRGFAQTPNFMGELPDYTMMLRWIAEDYFKRKSLEEVVRIFENIYIDSW